MTLSGHTRVDPLLDRRRNTLFNLHRAEVIASPWTYYATVRDRGMWFDPYLRSWLVARHAAVAAVLGDATFSVEMGHETRLAATVSANPSLQRAFRYLDRHVSFVDAADHRRLRGVLSAPFRPSHVRAVEGFVAGVVVDALRQLATAPRPDVVADLASPVALRVITHLLGIEHIALATLRRWSTAWGDVVAAPGHIPTGNRTRLLADVDELIETLTTVVAEHRRHHRDTVTGVLVRAADRGELSEAELIGNLMMLVTAGNETTTNLISNAVQAMMADPELWEQLQADRTLLPAAVEEFARIYPPTQYTARTATVDVEIGGQLVRAGEPVVLLLAAANRDPDMFPDPDQIRLDRPGGRHLAFGYGPHFCFGAALAWLETRLVLDGLLDRPRPRPAGAPCWRLNGNLRGLESLPVFLPQVHRHTRWIWP